MQVMIIDVQNTYMIWCKNLLRGIPEFCKFSKNYYVWDNVSGENFEEEFPDDWREEEYQEFYDSLNIIDKQYGFFRSLMDLGLDEDDESIVQLVKFMQKHRIYDSRMILENDDVHREYKVLFKSSPLMNINLDDYPISIPEDLIQSFHDYGVSDGVILVGGSTNACLKEVAILLRVMDIDYIIEESLTYA